MTCYHRYSCVSCGKYYYYLSFSYKKRELDLPPYGQHSKRLFYGHLVFDSTHFNSLTLTYNLDLPNINIVFDISLFSHHSLLFLFLSYFSSHLSQLLHICRTSITTQTRMDYQGQGHNQNPSMGVVGSGPPQQVAYGSNPYQPNHFTGQPDGTQLGQHQLVYQQVHQQQQQQLQQHLQHFWANQSQEIDKATDFKNHSLPLARIKKIMKADEDVRMISAEAPVVFARACEMFILELTLRSWNHTEENKRRTLQKNDIAAAITGTDIFDFLVDIVPREDLKDEVLASIPRGTMAVAGPADGLPYCYMPPQHGQQVGNSGVMMHKPMMDPNVYAPQQQHPYMAPQMWPHMPEQQQSPPDH